MHLFVYGTLKRGQCRRRWLAGQTFVAMVRTKPLFRLYNVSTFPALVRSVDGLAIEGELWIVDENCLRVLDREEGCDTGLYRRESVELEAPHDSAGAIAYVYQQSIAGLADCGTRWGL
jgi:gamma-glutamylaminecyclotransferase